MGELVQPPPAARTNRRHATSRTRTGVLSAQSGHRLTQANRTPENSVWFIAIPVGREAPAPLKRAARIVNLNWVLPLVTRKGTPVHSLETILVHLAARPAAVRSWSAILAALPDVVAEVDYGDVLKELSGRPAAVATRLAYLVHGLSPELAEAVKPTHDHGKVWFGPRAPLKRHNSEFNIADTILPVDPATLNDQPSA